MTLRLMICTVLCITFAIRKQFEHGNALIKGAKIFSIILNWL